MKIDYYIVLTRHKAAAYISLYAMANNKQGTKKALGPIFGAIRGHILRSISIASLASLSLGDAQKTRSSRAVEVR